MYSRFPGRRDQEDVSELPHPHPQGAAPRGLEVLQFLQMALRLRNASCGGLAPPLLKATLNMLKNKT